MPSLKFMSEFYEKNNPRSWTNKSNDLLLRDEKQARILRRRRV